MERIVPDARAKIEQILCGSALSMHRKAHLQAPSQRALTLLSKDVVCPATVAIDRIWPSMVVAVKRKEPVVLMP
jgi:hypothetical protein